jgi:hypothetical protein
MLLVQNMEEDCGAVIAEPDRADQEGRSYDFPAEEDGLRDTTAHGQVSGCLPTP